MDVTLIPPKHPVHRVHQSLEQHVAYLTSLDVHPLVHQTTLAPLLAVGRVLPLRLRLHLQDQSQGYDTPHDVYWKYR